MQAREVNALEPKDFANRNVAFSISVFTLVNCVFLAFADRLGNPVWKVVHSIAAARPWMDRGIRLYSAKNSDSPYLSCFTALRG